MTPLELLHPRGYVHTAVVIGEEFPEHLRPAAPPPSGDDRAELVLLGKDADRLTVEIADDGVAYALGRGRVADELRRRGFGAAHFLHRPSYDLSAQLVALESAPLRYALSGDSFRARAASLAARLFLGRAALRAALDTGTLFFRPEIVPLGWLGDGEIHNVVIDTSSHGATSTSVIRVVHGDRLGAVVKIGAPPSTSPAGMGEANALRALGRAASDAGAAVPSIVDQRELDGAPVTFESAVAGQPASRLLDGKPQRAAELIERVCTWLAQWNARTAAVQPVTRAILERHVLGPAADIADRAQLEQLRARCDTVEGSSAPLVAVHQDLTMTNVLVNEGELGVVDWASARSEGLPLTDFFYAALDARAAVDRYRDRSQAFSSCFSGTGDWSARVERLEAGLCERLGVDRDVADLAFHATWLQHAANEARRGEEGHDFRELALRARDLR